MKKKMLFFSATTPFKIYQFFRPSVARPIRKISQKLGLKWPENDPNIRKRLQIGKLEMEKNQLLFSAPTPFKIYQFFRPSAARPFRKIAKKLGFKWPENHPNIHKKSQIGKLEMERNQLLFSPPTPFKKKQEQEDFHPVNLPTFFVCQQSLLFFLISFFFHFQVWIAIFRRRRRKNSCPHGRSGSPGQNFGFERTRRTRRRT